MTEQESIQKEVEQPDKTDKPDKKGKKGFDGFKATLNYTGEGIAISAPIRYKKIQPAVDIKVETLHTQTKQPLRQVSKEVGTNKLILNKTHKVYVDGQGNEVPPSQVGHYTREGEELIPMQKFARTKTIEILKVEPITKANRVNFSGSSYEVWGDNCNIYELAEHLHKAGLIAISKFSFGRGFKQYHAILFPILEGEEYGFIMRLGIGTNNLNHMTAKTATFAEAEEEPAQEGSQKAEIGELAI